MDNNTIAIIATAVGAILTFIGFGAKILNIVKAVKESLDVLVAGFMAFSDGKVTPEEIEKFKTELDEAKEAWKLK